MISRILIHKGRTACGAMAAVLLLSALTGCSTEHEVGPGAENAKLITFTPAVSNATPGTRAAAGHPIENGGNIPEGKSFGVYAYSRPSSTGTAGSYDAELPNNTEVTHNGTAFTYSPVAQWPIQNGAQLSFYGYYPWQDPTSLTPLVDPVIEVMPVGSSVMWIVYTTPQNPAKHIDLMYAHTDFTTGYEPVEMDFHHALTRVNFKGKVEDFAVSVVINSITVKDIRPQGMLNIAAGMPIWANSIEGPNTAPIDMTLTGSNGLVQNPTLDPTLGWLSQPGGSTETAGDMLVIPQSVQDMVVEVEATIGTNTTPETFTFPLAGTPDWKMNQIVTYEITIAGNGMRITPQIRSNWDDNHIEVIQDGQWWMYMDEDEFEFDVNAGTQTLSLETNYNPDPLQDFPVGLFVEAVGNGDEITYDPALTYTQSPWLTLTAKTGADGDLDREIEIKTAPNTGMTARKASFTVTAGNLSKVIHVTQLPYVITKAEVSYGGDGLPLAPNNSTPVIFHLKGTFPASTAQVRIFKKHDPDHPFGGTAAGASDGNTTVSTNLVVAANPSWDTREFDFQYYDPHAGAAGEWITIDTQEQEGYKVTATATPWTQAGAGTSTVQITGYRPQLQVRAIVEGATIPLSIATVNRDGTGAANLTIPALPGGVNERDIHIEYSHEVPATNWFPITTFTQTNSNSIAGRFARSNVVWDGSKLTFATTAAENTTVAPANSQGVFFRWGSLVAVSPTVVGFSSDQILFSATNTSYNTWDNIPYVNEQTGKWSNTDKDEDDFAGYDGNTNMSGPGYNASTNKGDICRYITDQGWIPAGEKWRLPTAAEYEILLSEAASVSNGGLFNGPNYAPEQGNNANGFWAVPSGRWLGKGAAADLARNDTGAAERVPGGSSVYFPASGDRAYDGNHRDANTFGYTLSGSSHYPNEAYAMRVWSGGASMRDDNIGRKIFFPIRCIRE